MFTQRAAWSTSQKKKKKKRFYRLKLRDQGNSAEPSELLTSLLAETRLPQTNYSEPPTSLLQLSF